MSLQRTILRNKKRNLNIVPSPYTKGTTLNKIANKIVNAIRNHPGTNFKKAFEQNLLFSHNQGEFLKYPPKGLEQLLKLAVEKKLKLGGVINANII
jgi:hypothetical protein